MESVNCEKIFKDVKIDKKKIKEELTRNLTQKELLLSEIVFNIDAKSNLEKKLRINTKRHKNKWIFKCSPYPWNFRYSK